MLTALIVRGSTKHNYHSYLVTSEQKTKIVSPTKPSVIYIADAMLASNLYE